MFQKQTSIMVLLVMLVMFCPGSDIANPVQGQAETVNPPVVAIELGSLEPPSGNIAAQVSFSFEQGQNFLDEIIVEPKWVYSRDKSYPGQTELIACGIPGTAVGLLTNPIGQTESVVLEPLFWGNNGDCWRYAMPWAIGTILGDYTLQIIGNNADIARTWTLTYPDYPTTLYTIPNQEIILMGFAPNQIVNVLFYGYNPAEATVGVNATFWASRQVRVDAEGAAILRLNIRPGAPYADVKYLIDGYPYAHYSWRRYDDWRAINNYSSPDTMIRQYYDAINHRWYDMAWENLSDHYKDKYNPDPNGGHAFEPYKNWWNSVARVDIQNLVVSDEGNDFATVTTTYTFTMQNGNQSQGTTEFTLIFSPSEHRWLFYEQD